jgi:hypothetical protein
MANPANTIDPTEARPRPVNPAASVNLDPLDPLAPAGAPIQPNLEGPPLVDNRSYVESRSRNTGVVVAGVIAVLAILAYFLFAPGGDNVPAAVNAPTVTETQPTTDATPAAPTAEAPAPAAPAGEATAPATDAAPATPAAPNVPAPAPAQPAPAQ